MAQEPGRLPNFAEILRYPSAGPMNAPAATLKTGGDETVKLFNDYRAFLDAKGKVPADF